MHGDLNVPAPLLRGDGGYDLNGIVNAAAPRLAAAGMELTAPTGQLVDRVREQSRGSRWPWRWRWLPVR